MKKLYLVLILILIISCKEKTDTIKNTANEEIEVILPSDTIQTPSGLQYFYLKKGKGRKIKDGSYVELSNQLYLNNLDTVFWSTYDEPDSITSWIKGKQQIIKGASELHYLLREGDHVVAIMPDSIAYGKKDWNGIPGSSTLIFNPMIIKSVSEPKKIISDTLLTALKTENVGQMMNLFNEISSSDLKDDYHFISGSIDPLLEKLAEEKKFKLLEEVCTTLMAHNSSTLMHESLEFSLFTSLEEQGKLEEAILYLKTLIEKEDFRHSEFAQAKIKELEEHLKNK